MGEAATATSKVANTTVGDSIFTINDSRLPGAEDRRSATDEGQHVKTIGWLTPMRLHLLYGVTLGALCFDCYAASFTPLGYLPGGNSSTPFAISADGAVVVGYATNSAFRFEAFQWRAGVMTGLGMPAGSTYSNARGTSADGSVIVGAYINGISRAARWNGGLMADLDGLSGYSASAADAVSADGTVVVGSASNTDADSMSCAMDRRNRGRTGTSGRLFPQLWPGYLGRWGSSGRQRR